MQRTILAALFITTAAFASSDLAAQAPNALVGKWNIEYERGRRIENGEATPIMGTGKLAIVASGDSLLATLEAGPRPDGSVPPPATFGGRATPQGVVFVQKQTAQINMNGETREQQMTLTWTLQASGDTLTGTLARELPGMPEPLPPAPVKGTRLKA